MDKTVKEAFDAITKIEDVIFFLNAAIAKYEENTNLKVHKIKWTKGTYASPSTKIILDSHA